MGIRTGNQTHLAVRSGSSLVSSLCPLSGLCYSIPSRHSSLTKSIMLLAFQEPLMSYHCPLKLSLFAFHSPFTGLCATILVLLKSIWYSFELSSIASHNYLDFRNHFMVLYLFICNQPLLSEKSYLFPHLNKWLGTSYDLNDCYIYILVGMFLFA